MRNLRNCAVTIKHMTLYGPLLWVGRFTTTNQQWAKSRLVLVEVTDLTVQKPDTSVALSAAFQIDGNAVYQALESEPPC